MNNRKKQIRIAIVFICIIMAILYIGISLFTNRVSKDDAWKQNKEAWKITQYGDPAVTQMMFYTIESSDGEFMIIDGGWRENEDALRRVIKEHGNHVDAWILTHPHPDHIGAFNEIVKNPGSIEIDMVYDVYIDLDEYEAVAREWDDISVYKEYWLLALEGRFPVKHIERDEEMVLMGLTIKCYNSYDSEVSTRTDVLCNNGSLMLKMSGVEESMLFCSDVEDEMQEFLTETYGEELSADYVQVSHHGNWGLTEEFYEMVSPKVAFFDGNTSLYEESTLYDGWKLMKYMKDQNITVYTYETQPNSIIMH